MAILETRIDQVIKRTYNVKSFRCEATGEVDFNPGQYMNVTIKVGEKHQTKCLSFSNSPTEKGFYEFTKKITSSDFSKVLDNLKSGDPIKLDLPKGSFTLDEGHPKAAFLSGGIGITPLHSMIKYAADRGLKIDMVLLYGNHTQKDIVFREDLEACAKVNEFFRVVHTLDAPEEGAEAWAGRTGFITADMIKEEIPDYKERKFYVCGPPQMVESLIKILKEELGLADESIKRENFSGY